MLPSGVIKTIPTPLDVLSYLFLRQQFFYISHTFDVGLDATSMQ